MKPTRMAGWKRMHVFISFILLSLALFQPVNAQPSQPFNDDFETDQGWGSFEEIVAGSACYGANIAEVTRSTDVAFAGTNSLRVWGNKALSAKSNHVIANKKVANVGQTGRFRYELYAFIAAETANHGEVGPEFSMQNTRELAPGQFRTSTVGIQYRANAYSPLYRSWAVWAEVSPGQANWQTFTITTAPTPGAWYFMAVEADYTTNQYVRFWLQGPDIDLSLDLSAYHIAPEVKFNEQAFWLTLESENIYNNCGSAGNYEYKVYYDDIVLRRLDENDIAIAASALSAFPTDDATNIATGQKTLFLPLIWR